MKLLFRKILQELKKTIKILGVIKIFGNNFQSPRNGLWPLWKFSTKNFAGKLPEKKLFFIAKNIFHKKNFVHLKKA